jgi:hypothetical protein
MYGMESIVASGKVEFADFIQAEKFSASSAFCFSLAQSLDRHATGLKRSEHNLPSLVLGESRAFILQ